MQVSSVKQKDFAGYKGGTKVLRATAFGRETSTGDWAEADLPAVEPTVESDGFLFYLEKGDNTIEFEVSQGNMANILLRLNDIIRKINAAYNEIRQITGASPDQYRDYGFYSLIPAAIDSLAEQSDALYEIVDELTEVNGKSQNITTLENIARTLYKMGHKEDEVAKNMGNLKTDIGNLGTWLQTAMNQPLGFDYITVSGADSGDKQLPKAKENGLQSLWFEVRMFALSFVADYNTLGATEKVSDEKSVVAWTSSSRDQGSSVWLKETPTPVPTQAGEPTPVETTPAAPVSSPVEPVQQTQTPASPAPFVGLLAGLGAAAVFFGLRRK